jgi:hypothetical protein
MNNKIKIPIVWGKNRLRGKSEGYLINEMSYNYPDATNQLTKSIQENAVDFTPDKDYLAKAIVSILGVCEKNITGDSKGFMAEMENGDLILFADERILDFVVI